MKRWISAALCAILLVQAVPLFAFAATVEQISLRAVEDAHIQGGRTGSEQNFGNDKGMMVRAANYRVALIKFDISRLPDTFRNVRLRLFKTSGRADVLYCAKADSDWQEHTVTYNTRPQWENQPLDTAHVTAGGVWFYFDVTAALQEAEGDFLSFAVYDPEGEENNIGISSREGGAHCPALLVDAPYVPEIASVTVEPSLYNQHSASIPLAGVMTVQAAATVRDQYDRPMDAAVSWSVSGANTTGVQVDQAGVVTILPTAAAGEITVTAEAGGYRGTVTYQLLPQTDKGKTFPSLLYSPQDLPAIRERIAREPYKSIYAESDSRKNRYDLERLDHADTINAWRSQNFSFTTAAGAKTVRLRLQLSGKGTLRLDNVKLSGLSIENNSFETGNLSSWTDGSKGGTIRVIAQSNTSYKAADNCGQRFAVLSAAGAGQTAEVACELPVQGEKYYSGSIVLGQDAVHEDGFYLYADSLDEAGQPLDSAVPLTFNRPTITRRNSLPTEHYANVYMNTGDPYYAQKAKKALLYMLWEMQWGVNHYMSTGQSLDDTYEAVHIGRAVKIACQIYDQIRDVSVEQGGFTPEEENILRARLYWIADTLMDTRYYDYTKEQSRKHNYNADRSVGLLVFAVTFPEYAKSDAYYRHAVDELVWILDNSVGEDGGWPESTRYHVAVLKSVAFAAKVMQRQGDGDLFAHPKVKKMFSFLMHVQMPQDCVAIDGSAGKADYPPVGDADYGDFFGCIYAGIEGYAQSDPLFAQQLQYVLNREGGEITDWLYGGPEDLTAVSPQLQSEVFADMGYAVFRQGYGTDAEEYAFFSAAGTLINSHQHEDRGSFILYADNTPISLDAGMCSYGSSQAAWYESPEAHNTVAFFDAAGKMYAGSRNAQIIDFYTSEAYDRVSARIDGSGNAGYVRHFVLLKNGLDAYVVWDEIDGGQNSRFGVHALATGVVGVGSGELTAACYNGKAFDISFLQPAAPKTAVTQTPLNNTRKWPRGEQQYITAAAGAGEDYLTVLYPRDASAPKLNKTLLAQADGARLYRISNGNAAYYVAVNMGDTAATLSVPTPLLDTRTMQRYSQGGQMQIDTKELLVLTLPAEDGILAGEYRLTDGTRDIWTAGQLAQAAAVSAEIAARNETNTAQSLQFVLGIYDSSGNLLETRYDRQRLEPQTACTLMLQQIALPKSSYRFQLFLWQDMHPVKSVLDWSVEK